MQLINAKVIATGKNVDTKRGKKACMTCLATDGKELTVWRPAGDPELMRLANGERVQVTVSSSGSVSLVETALDRAQKLVPEPNRSAEIADYVQRLGKLFKYCYSTTADQLVDTTLTTAQIKDISIEIFTQSIHHFDL